MSNDTNPDGLDGVMRRIRKLLAIAEDGRGDANECAAAARMAEMIMRKHQIEHAEVFARQAASGDAAAFDTADVFGTMTPEAHASSVCSWAGALAVAIAELNDAQARIVVAHKGLDQGAAIRFSGFASDVAVCRYTFLAAVASMRLALRHHQRVGGGTSRRAGESFRLGYVNAVCESLRRAASDKKAEMQQQASSRALVLVKDSAVAKHFGEVSYRRGHRRSAQGEAFAAGREAGSRFDVGRRGIGAAAGAAAIANG